MYIYSEEKKLIIIPDAAIPVAVLSSFHDRTLLIDCLFKSDGMPAEHKTDESWQKGFNLMKFNVGSLMQIWASVKVLNKVKNK